MKKIAITIAWSVKRSLIFFPHFRPRKRLIFGWVTTGIMPFLIQFEELEMHLSFFEKINASGIC
jgi:hypothetical protein